MSETMKYTLSTVLPWLMLVIGLILAVSVNPFATRETRKRILLIEGNLILLLAAESTEYVISGSSPNDLLRTFCAVYAYAVRPALLTFFLEMGYRPKRKYLIWIPAFLNCAVCLVSFFTGVAFSIRENIFLRGPLNWVCLFCSVLLIVKIHIELIRNTRRERRKENVLIFFGTGLIVAGIVTDCFILPQLYPVSYLTRGIIGAMICYYAWLNVNLYRCHEELSLVAMQERHRIELMTSQIQPHFLYNTLSTIQALCKTNPDRAFDLTEQFGRYLRQNLSLLNSQTAPIPFLDEIEHTRVYAEIEQTRFPSIRITYDLQDTDFSLPVLTIQPLVENAVRHGVRARVQGEIQISSRREENKHIVEIRDNGDGFDISSALLAGSEHIGLRNVKDRIETMCSGTMEIRSRIGVGTTVTIRLPAGKERK